MIQMARDGTKHQLLLGRKSEVCHGVLRKKSICGWYRGGGLLDSGLGAIAFMTDLGGLEMGDILVMAL